MMVAEKKVEKEVEGFKMNITLLEQSKDKLKCSFILKDTNPAIANALRRVIIEEVPVLAIEDVEFRSNNSVLYDEIIAHRLGLIPIITDLKSYKLSSECKCKGAGCAMCQLKLTLKSKGGKLVTSGSIKSKDPKAVPTSDDFPIVKLLKDQDIALEATAILGQGKDHMKWSSGLCFYKYKPSIDITKQPKNSEQCSKVCPQKVFDVKAGKLSVNKDKLLRCHLCEACTDLCPEIKLNESESEFVFYLESWGQLKCKDILKQAADIMCQKSDAFLKSVKETK